MKYPIVLSALICLANSLCPPVVNAQSLLPAPTQYKGQPLQSIFTNDGHVFAVYGEKPYGREWLVLTTDTVHRLKMMSESVLLSPSRDRYFYVSVVPDFAGLYYAMHPNYDSDTSETFGGFDAWAANDMAMYLKVYLLSGQQVTTVPLRESYWAEYTEGRWLDNRWILLQTRPGRTGGHLISLFINVQTGEKRPLGTVIDHEAATPDGRYVTFVRRGLFHVNFRPVYPIYGEALPDFGDELGLYRLVRCAKARVRASARPPAERAAILAEIERQYRAALQAELAERRPREKRPG